MEHKHGPDWRTNYPRLQRNLQLKPDEVKEQLLALKQSSN